MDCKILVFEVTKILFLAMRKSRAALHKGTFVCKNVQNGGASLDLFFKESWLYA